jgi:tetrapyrrole methylase family protein/MazG family protein
LRALEVLGLTGAYQVHIAPVVLRPDLRAHQVFVGFSDLSPVRDRLLRLLPGETKCWSVDGSDAIPLVLSEVDSAATLVLPAQSDENPGGLYGVVWLVDRLLGPGGCPWDQEQTHESLKRHLIEEAYELLQAIDDRADDKMKEELGDVLLQPVMHAQMRALAGGWDTDEIATLLVEKLVRRHPHVFSPSETWRADLPGGQISADQVLQNWDEIKKQEKGEPQSVLEGVPQAMPALLRAYEVSKRAARSGFEWPDQDGVWDKLHEEEQELKQAISSNEGIEDEVGDLLFTVVNIARWNKVEPEDALCRMLDRFTRRFQAMERAAKKPLRELNSEEWDALWNRAKLEAP